MHAFAIDKFRVVSLLADIIVSSDSTSIGRSQGASYPTPQSEEFRKPQHARHLLSATGVTMLAASALLVIACSSANSKAAATTSASVPVDAVRVRQDNGPLIGDSVGTLDGFVNARIQAQVSGYQGGATSYLEILTTDSSLFAARLNLVNSNSQEGEAQS